MDAFTLVELVDQRYAVLVELLRLSKDQVTAIRDCRMTDLMSILSAKQKPIKQLLTLAEQLKPAVHDDPEARSWPDPQSRINCRDRQKQCDSLHGQLLEIEAACEKLLVANRDEVSQRLQNLSRGSDAKSGYSQSQSYASAGRRGGLDLSSD